jgi:hypothetical protein
VGFKTGDKIGGGILRIGKVREITAVLNEMIMGSTQTSGRWVEIQEPTISRFGQYEILHATLL